MRKEGLTHLTLSGRIKGMKSRVKQWVNRAWTNRWRRKEAILAESSKWKEVLENYDHPEEILYIEAAIKTEGF